MSNTPKDKPTTPPSNDNTGLPIDEIRDRAQQAYEQAPPEFKEGVEKTKSFYEANKPIIITAGVILVVMKVNKRMVRKATAKAVRKALKSVDEGASVSGSIPMMKEIINELRETPAMRYIPHGGGAVHLPVTKDIILTLAGNFEDMTNSDIDAYAIKKLMQLI